MTSPRRLALAVRGDLDLERMTEWLAAARSAGARVISVRDAATGAGLAGAGALCRWLVALSEGEGPPVRPGVVVEPGRRPVTVLAKALNTLDVISEGRLEVALTGSAEVRAEAAAVLRQAASGATLDGTHGSVGAYRARCLPAARQQPCYPLWEARPHPGPAAPAGAEWLELVPL